MSYTLAFVLALNANISSTECLASEAGAALNVSLSSARHTVALGNSISATVVVSILAPQVTLEHSDAGAYSVEAYDTSTGNRVQTPLKTITMINAKTYFQGDEIVDTLDLNKMAILHGPGNYAFRIDRVTKSGSCYRSNEIHIDIVPAAINAIRRCRMR